MTEGRPAPIGEDWLEGVLRAEAAEHAAGYIADDGFTARVLAALPPPPALPAWRRPVVALLWAAAGAAVVAAFPAWFDEVFRAAAALLFGHRFTLWDLAAALTVLLGTAAGALVFAARTD